MSTSMKFVRVHPIPELRILAGYSCPRFGCFFRPQNYNFGVRYATPSNWYDWTCESLAPSVEEQEFLIVTTIRHRRNYNNKIVCHAVDFTIVERYFFNFLEISRAPISINFIQLSEDGPAKAPVMHIFKFVHINSKVLQNTSPQLGWDDLSTK